MPFESKLLRKVREENYGQETVLDIHDVPDEFFQLKTVRQFAETLCDEIGMIRGPMYTWGGEKKDLHAHPEKPKIDGISCIQFLHSSSITIHAIDELNKVFINVFSCESFDADRVKQFALKNVGGVVVGYHNYERK
jgi:S-adenosylmethionine/arginine decarboxylase-like enzyme